MKTRKVIFIAIFVPLLAGILSFVPVATANSIPSEGDLKEMFDEFDGADADAAKNIPGTRTKQAVEDKLDQAEQKVDDDRRALDKRNAQDPRNAADVAIAEKALKDAEAARDEAKKLADEVQSRFPDKDEAYREALKRRRDARKKLKDANDAMEPAMRSLGRRVVEDDVREIRRRLGQSGRYPDFNLLGALPLAELSHSGLVNCQVIGKGQTVGAVAEIKITNNGSEAYRISIPPLILISRSGDSQNYAAPIPQVVEVPPGETVSAPIQGVCLNRSRPPAAEGASGSMILQDINATVLTPSAEVSDPGQAEEARKLDQQKAVLHKNLADATNKHSKAAEEYGEFADAYIDGNKESKDKIMEKHQEYLDAVEQRTAIGVEELDRVHEEKGERSEPEMQESLTRQIKDLGELKDSFERWQEQTVEEAIRKEGGPTLENFIGKRDDLRSSGEEMDGIKKELQQVEESLKRIRDPKNNEYVPNETARILTAVTSIYKAVEELQKEGELDKMPYPSPAKQREIALQWGTWADGEVAQSTGEKPATKEDIAEVIEKQVAEGKEVTPEIKKQLQPGIDNIWAAVELTGTKAKSLTEEQYGAPEEE